MRKLNLKPYVFSAIILGVSALGNTGCVSKSYHEEQMQGLKTALLEQRVNNLEAKIRELEGSISEQDHFFYQWCESIAVYAEKIGKASEQRDRNLKGDTQALAIRIYQMLHPGMLLPGKPDKLNTSLKQ